MRVRVHARSFRGPVHSRVSQRCQNVDIVDTPFLSEKTYSPSEMKKKKKKKGRRKQG